MVIRTGNTLQVSLRSGEQRVRAKHLVTGCRGVQGLRGPCVLRISSEPAPEHKHQFEVKAYRPAEGETTQDGQPHAQMHYFTHAIAANDLTVNWREAM